MSLSLLLFYFDMVVCIPVWLLSWRHRGRHRFLSKEWCQIKFHGDNGYRQTSFRCLPCNHASLVIMLMVTLHDIWFISCQAWKQYSSCHGMFTLSFCPSFSSFIWQEWTQFTAWFVSFHRMMMRTSESCFRRRFRVALCLVAWIYSFSLAVTLLSFFLSHPILLIRLD